MSENSSKSGAKPINAVPPLLGWLAMIAVVIAGIAAYERYRLTTELQSEAAILHRLASQRADQHDAHLTSLSAVAVASDDRRQDLFLDVATTILRFYPSIRSVDLVPLDPGREWVSTRATVPDDLAATIVGAARVSDGALQVRISPTDQGRYLLVKRSPNSDAARYGLALDIDAAALVSGGDNGFWDRPSVIRRLRLPDGTIISGSDAERPMQFEKVLGSISQPLIFEAGIAPEMADLLPLGRIVAVLTALSALYVAAVLGWHQIVRTRDAESRARLSAQEAQLAHASRVNALGEMASGMAHELTQPLTAILSQVQAGQHLLQRGEQAALKAVLDDTVTQARRAADILDRLRRWTRPARSPSQVIDLADAVRSVEDLLRAEARRLNVALILRLGSGPVTVRGDRVELEQVIFNLVRNALDALEGAGGGTITVIAAQSGNMATLEVADTGPGVPETLRSRLFEPFVTSRADGTGFGLALCQRLIEQMGGDIVYVPDREGAVFRLIIPVAEQSRERHTR